MGQLLHFSKPPLNAPWSGTPGPPWRGRLGSNTVTPARAHTPPPPPPPPAPPPPAPPSPPHPPAPACLLTPALLRRCGRRPDQPLQDARLQHHAARRPAQDAVRLLVHLGAATHRLHLPQRHRAVPAPGEPPAPPHLPCPTGQLPRARGSPVTPVHGTLEDAPHGLRMPQLMRQFGMLAAPLRSWARGLSAEPWPPCLEAGGVNLLQGPRPGLSHTSNTLRAGLTQQK